MQQITAEVVINIPSDYVLVKKAEFEQLEADRLEGVFWTMKDLEQRTNKKQEWLKDNVLYQPRFKKELDVEHGGFVYYPKKSGEKWSFQASKMAKFLEENFYLIFSK